MSWFDEPSQISFVTSYLTASGIRSGAVVTPLIGAPITVPSRGAVL